VYDRFHYRVNDAACVQGDGHSVTDLELGHFVWLFAGGHREECAEGTFSMTGMAPLNQLAN
jgi:sorbitol-specific phosphotransferase system component IIA